MVTIPYAATATARLRWGSLPAAVRSPVTDRLGSPVVDAVSAGAGFTGGFASRLLCADGTRAFVKAESAVRNPPIAAAYQREAEVNRALPAGLPAPALLWAFAADDWIVLGFEDVGGRVPQWSAPDDAVAVFALVREVSERLAVPPEGLALRTLAEECSGELMVWREWSGPVDAREWTSLEVDRLARLEAHWEDAAAGTAMIHCDLRADNILVGAGVGAGRATGWPGPGRHGPAGGRAAEPVGLRAAGPVRGRAWLCDWNWPCLAAGWVDLVMLLPAAFGAGIDADAVLAADPIGRLADPDAVNAVLAAFAGMFVVRSAEPPPANASPWIRGHQRHYGRLTLAWLEHRLSC
jgi:hypothetical protein